MEKLAGTDVDRLAEHPVAEHVQQGDRRRGGTPEDLIRQVGELRAELRPVADDNGADRLHAELVGPLEGNRVVRLRLSRLSVHRLLKMEDRVVAVALGLLVGGNQGVEDLLRRNVKLACEGPPSDWLSARWHPVEPASPAAMMTDSIAAARRRAGPAGLRDSFIRGPS